MANSYEDTCNVYAAWISKEISDFSDDGRCVVERQPSCDIDKWMNLNSKVVQNQDDYRMLVASQGLHAPMPVRSKDQAKVFTTGVASEEHLQPKDDIDNSITRAIRQDPRILTPFTEIISLGADIRVIECLSESIKACQVKVKVLCCGSGGDNHVEVIPTNIDEVIQKLKVLQQAAITQLSGKSTLTVEANLLL
eukprot:TRINITY_DN66271_c6_g1_i1.p1 TRINITY_DN66271_c6_g1~~TRINITY_DN66271_c6_g1_i1.p1  ORF type:complete len:194 (-),score=20.70 TRINITY_DN66271_c6_g1_i1:103-684(-)